MRRYLTPRCLALHAMLLVLLPAFLWLTDWQYHRAVGGNSLSWAYVFLWPAFAVYAVYTWWNLVHDQVARQDGSGTAVAGSGEVSGQAAGRSGSQAPGWALSGGRKKNVAIAAAVPIDAEAGGKGERFTAQTADEAERLEAYNRYLAGLAAADEATGPGR